MSPFASNNKWGIFFPFTATISTRISYSFSLLFIILITNTKTYTNASWIDIDTPGEAHTTQYPAHQYHEPRHPPKPKNATKIKLKAEAYLKKHGHAAPTPSPAPPTLSPTMSPTLSPTPDPHHYSAFTLVMSDEFNVPGRSFTDGSDPTWTAMDKNDYTNNALHYYSPSRVTTSKGSLDIKTTAERTEVVGFDDEKGEREKVDKNFKSAMLQSWNKFCFTGGIIEVREFRGLLGPRFCWTGPLARAFQSSSKNLDRRQENTNASNPPPPSPPPKGIGGAPWLLPNRWPLASLLDPR